MIFTEESIIDSLTEIGFHDFDRIIMSPIGESKLLALPYKWQELLRGNKSIDSFLDDTWTFGSLLLPRTLTLLKNKVKHIVVIEQKSGKLISLLYIFTQKDTLRYRVGYPPINVLPTVFQKLPIDLLEIYKIHNGFVDLISCDAGFLPADKCDVFLNEESGNTESFLKIFGVGSNSLGFDLETKVPYIIWGSDEEVEPVNDFLLELDQWIASGIEDFDDITSI